MRSFAVDHEHRAPDAAAGALAEGVVGTMPTPDGPFEIPARGVPSPTRDTTGNVDAMALYAGESVAAIDRVEPAAAIVRRLMEEATALLAAPTVGTPFRR